MRNPAWRSSPLPVEAFAQQLGAFCLLALLGEDEGEGPIAAPARFKIPPPHS
jgi:hypothetical protein